MTPQQIVAVCLRLLAAVWLFNVLSQANAAYMFAETNAAPEGYITVMWLLAIAQLMVCAAMWFFPMTIAAVFLPFVPASQQQAAAPIPIENWQIVGVVLIGLWGLSRAVVDAIYWASMLSVVVGSGDGLRGLGAEQKAGIITTIVEIVISLWLLLGAKGVAAAIYKVRTAGVAK